MDLQGLDASRSDSELASGFLEARESGALISESLTKTIAERLLARLAGAAAEADASEGLDQSSPTDAELDKLCDELISDDQDAAAAHIRRLYAKGVTADTLCLRYIGAAAQRLGERWTEDTAGFLEVTLGLARLHGILRTLGGDFLPDATQKTDDMRALFSAVPGDTHVMGITMASEFFRRAGWTVDLNVSPEHDQLCETARIGEYSLIGLSAGCRAIIPALKTTVAGLRKAAPESKIVLGGHLTELEPGLTDELGIETVSHDVTIAPIVLRKAVLKGLEC